jgi:putative ABC transport system permease protein
VVLLAIGYTLAAQATTDTVVVLFLVVSGLTVVGVWAFSRGAAGLLVGLLRRNKVFFWKGSRMVALSHVAHRLGSYARVNFVIALVSSVAIIALGVGLNLKLAIETQLAAEYPHQASLVYRTPADRNKLIQKLETLGVKFRPALQFVALHADRHLPTAASGQTHQSANLTLLSASEFHRLTGNTSLESPGEGQAFLLEANPAAAKGWLAHYELLLDGDERGLAVDLNVSRVLSLAVIDDAQTRQTLVVSEADWQRWADQNPKALWTQQDGSLSGAEAVAASVRELEWAGEGSVFRTDFGPRSVSQAMDLYLFAGLFLGLVFLFCAGAVLHFKHLMEARDDRARFDVLRKIGLDARQERNAALMQVIPVYALPLFLAGVNGAVALATMGRLMDIDIVVPVAVELGGFTIVFGLMAAVTTRAYLKLIR